MEHPNFAIGSNINVTTEDNGSEEDYKEEQTQFDQKEEQTEVDHKEEEKDDEIIDLNKSQRFTMVRGKLGTEEQQDEQEK